MELDHYFYRINQVFLSACGFWPNQSRREKTIRRFIFFIIEFNNFPPLIAYAFCNWGDADAINLCMIFVAGYILGITKMLNNIIQDRKIQFLFKQIKYHWNIWSSEPQLQLLQEFAEESRSYNFIYTVALCASASGYTFVTAAPEIYHLFVLRTNGTRDPYIFAIEYGFDNEKYFNFILVLSNFSVWMNIIIVITVDKMYLTFVQHAYGILQAVGNRFENINLMYHNQGGKNLKLLIKDIFFCIHQHNIALKFANILNDVYSMYFLCTMVINAGNLVFAASQVVINLDNLNEVVRWGNYGMLLVCYLFFSSFPAQKLMDYSSTTSQNILWVNSNVQCIIDSLQTMELDNYFYRINQVLLSACGFWPQQSKREKTIRRFIFFIIDLSNFPPLIVYACYNWRDADALAVCFAFITSYSLGVTKISNNIIQDKKIQYLFKQIKYHWNVWSSEPQVKLIQQFANQARSYNFMYTVAVCASASSYTVITVVPEIYYLLAQCTNVTRDPSIFAEEFGIDSEKYFHWILAYSVISVWVNSIIYVTADIMYLTLVQHACGILCAVGNRFEDVNLLYRNQTAKNLNFLIFKDLLFCIQQHNIALKFANILNEVYSLYFLCTVGLNAASLVFVASQTVIHLDKFDNVVKFGNYGLLIICLLFLSSFPAQKLMDQSSTISQNIYNTYWYEMPISIKKSLFFVLVRTSNLCTIKIWKFYVLSLQTFASILQTTISVCMLLLSVR